MCIVRYHCGFVALQVFILSVRSVLTHSLPVYCSNMDVQDLSLLLLLLEMQNIMIILLCSKKKRYRILNMMNVEGLSTATTVKFFTENGFVNFS